MAFPVLTKDLDYEVWRLQFESATKSKVFSKLTGTDKDDEALLASYRLSALPSALHEEILFGCTDKFSVGTTTYKTAQQAVRDQWVRITRPTDITTEMHAIKIHCNDDVVPAWQRFLRLKYYTTISDDFLSQLLVNSIADAVTKQSVQTYMFGKTISPKQIVDFLSALTFSSPVGEETTTVGAVNLRCFSCNESATSLRTVGNGKNRGNRGITVIELQKTK